MSSTPMYTVHHQSYWVPGRPGQPPEIVRKAQWVQVPPGQLNTAQQVLWAAYVEHPQGAHNSGGQGTYYRLNPAGTLSEFSYPAYKPTVGAGNWDPAKPMPVQEYFAQGGQKPFHYYSFIVHGFPVHLEEDVAGVVLHISTWSPDKAYV